MARPPTPPRTTLGVALRAARGQEDQEELGLRLKLSRPTLSRLERGTHRPNADTALKLARWLGWTMEQVMQAADQPALPTDTPAQEP